MLKDNLGFTAREASMLMVFCLICLCGVIDMMLYGVSLCRLVMS